MEKTLLIAAALLLAGGLNVIRAQDETEYPQWLGSEYSYTLDGVVREAATTAMLKRMVEQEASRYDSIYVMVTRWTRNNYGNYITDTIASYAYKGHDAILADAERLDSDEYKESMWSFNMTRYATSPTDTLEVLRFNYSRDEYLTYYQSTGTSYVAYAGHPYMLQEVSNPLKLPLTYTSSDEKVATVEDDGRINVAGAGQTVITAAFPGSDDIKASSAQWTLVVEDGDYLDLSIMVVVYDKQRNWYRPEWIAVTEDNCSDILGDGHLSYDFKTRTLTMDNFQREFTEEEDMSLGMSQWLAYCTQVPCPFPLAINVKGDCFVKHNSAGIAAPSSDLIIYGDKNSSLIMSGRFPQFSVGGKLTIDGCKVYAKGTTPHPLVMCETLRVENDSYFESFIDLSQFDPDPDMDPREWGAMAGQVENLEMGDDIAMLTQDVHIEDGVFVDSKGHAALLVQIGPKNGGAITTDPVKGDVNADKVVDVADIATVIDVMAGTDTTHAKRADVNDDGNVDVADIAAIIDIMAGK